MLCSGLWNLYPMHAQPKSQQRLKGCPRRLMELHFPVVFSPSGGELFNLQAPQPPSLFLSRSVLLGLSPFLYCSLKTICGNQPKLVVEPTISFLSPKHQSSELFKPMSMNSYLQGPVSWLLVAERQIWFLWLILKGNETRECLKI